MNPSIDRFGNRYWSNDAGSFHRIDGPAAEYINGRVEWYQDGLLHREDGPAILGNNGSEHWYWRGKKHRELGPSSIYSNGYSEWHYHGQLHCLTGPAITRLSDNHHEYWVFGKPVTEAEFNFFFKQHESTGH